MVKVMYVDHAPVMGGAELVLLDLVRCLDRQRYHPIVATAPYSPLMPFLAAERIGEILAYNKPHEKQYLDKAVAHLDRAAFLSPRNEYVRIVLGHALWFSGRRDEAIAALKDSVSLSPSGYRWSVLGSFYLEVKDWDAAIAALRNALALEPGRTDAWFGLGEAYQGKGAREEALEAWRRVVELAPGSELGQSAASKMSNPGR